MLAEWMGPTSKSLRSTLLRSADRLGDRLSWLDLVVSDFGAVSGTRGLPVVIVVTPTHRSRGTAAQGAAWGTASGLMTGGRDHVCRGPGWGCRGGRSWPPGPPAIGTFFGSQGGGSDPYKAILFFQGCSSPKRLAQTSSYRYMFWWRGVLWRSPRGTPRAQPPGITST